MSCLVSATDLLPALLPFAVLSCLPWLLLRRRVGELGRREAAARLVTEQAADAILIFDRDLQATYVNPAASQMSGYSREELLARRLGDLLPAADRPALPAHVEALTRDSYARDEWRLKRRDGSLRTIDFTLQRLPDGRYLAIGRDVTLARDAQEVLKESERRFRKLFENASDAAFVIDSSGRFVEINQRACDSLGYERQQLLAMRPSEVEMDYSLEQLCRRLREEKDIDGTTVYGHHRRADGSRFPVEMRLSSYDMDGQPYCLCLVRDITEREQMFEALCASEEFSRAVLDSTSSLVAVLDRGGGIVAVNEAWRRCARADGHAPAALAGTDVGSNFLEALLGLAAGDQSRDIGRGIRQVLEGSQDYFKLDCRCETDGRARWFFVRVAPLSSGTGGAVVSYVDITDIKRGQDMQARAAEQLKALANKHLAIQEEERRLLSMELHDQVGQTLTALKLNLESLRRRVAEMPPAQSSLTQAMAIVDGLVDTTRDISRRLRPPMLDDLGLASAVRWHIDKLTTPDGVEVSLYEDLGDERLPAQIELACFRVLQEAVSNALRHARASAISVALRRQPGRLHLAVRDNGIGFDVESTWRNARSLASLGLLGMRERVAGLDGSFRVKSSPGAGTEVGASFTLAVSA